MTDIRTLAAAIAPLIGGTIVTTGTEIDMAPADKDIAWIGLNAPHDGLRVVLRHAGPIGAANTRVRAVMYQTHANRDGADFRETPAFHELETAAAMSRGAEVIARQIKAKIIAPAIPMLEEWNAKRAAQKESIRQHETAIAAFRKRFPGARINWRGGYYDPAEFGLSHQDGAVFRFIDGEIHHDGTFSIKRTSRLDQSAAFDLIAALTKK